MQVGKRQNGGTCPNSRLVLLPGLQMELGPNTEDEKETSSMILDNIIKSISAFIRKPYN